MPVQLFTWLSVGRRQSTYSTCSCNCSYWTCFSARSTTCTASRSCVTLSSAGGRCRPRRGSHAWHCATSSCSAWAASTLTPSSVSCRSTSSTRRSLRSCGSGSLWSPSPPPPASYAGSGLSVYTSIGYTMSAGISRYRNNNITAMPV